MRDDWIQWVIPCKSHLCISTSVMYHSVQTVCLYECTVGVSMFVWWYVSCVWRRLRGQSCWIRHSRVSLSVLLSVELEIANSSLLSASSSVPPFVRAPWMAFLSSSFSCWLSRMKPGMQIRNEIVRRLRVRPRYAILRSKRCKKLY